MGLLEFRSFGLSGEDADICIDLASGWQLLPSVRGRDWIVPRLAGRQQGNRRKDVLIIPLAGTIKGSGEDPEARLEDFNANVEAVIEVMMTNQTPGTLSLSDGYLGLLPGVVASIEARCRNGSPGRIESYHMVPIQRWTFELEAIDPEWDIGT